MPNPSEVYRTEGDYGIVAPAMPVIPPVIVSALPATIPEPDEDEDDAPSDDDSTPLYAP